MRVAFGALGWTPDVFWASTLTEYTLAREGLNEDRTGPEKDKGPSDDELAELVKRYG